MRESIERAHVRAIPYIYRRLGTTGGGGARPFPRSPRCDVFAGVDTEQIYADAVRILRDCGLNAAVADTGGGTVCITVSKADAASDEPRFTFGAAGKTWAAEVAWVRNLARLYRSIRGRGSW